MVELGQLSACESQHSLCARSPRSVARWPGLTNGAVRWDPWPRGVDSRRNPGELNSGEPRPAQPKTGLLGRSSIQGSGRATLRLRVIHR